MLKWGSCSNSGRLLQRLCLWIAARRKNKHLDYLAGKAYRTWAETLALYSDGSVIK